MSSRATPWPAEWSRRGDSNPRPAVYETAALPLSYTGPVLDPRYQNALAATQMCPVRGALTADLTATPLRSAPDSRSNSLDRVSLRVGSNMTVDVHCRADLRVPQYLHRYTGRDSLSCHQRSRPVPQVMVAHGRDTGRGEDSAEAAAHRGAMQGFANLARKDQLPPPVTAPRGTCSGHVGAQPVCPATTATRAADALDAARGVPGTGRGASTSRRAPRGARVQR
jgi:hypothetical protein